MNLLFNRYRALWPAGLALLITASGCGSFQRQSTPAPVVDLSSKTAPPTPEAEPTAQAQPVAPFLNPQALPLPINPSPNSYAAREDVPALAKKLAERHRLDIAWVESALRQAQVNDTVARLIMPASSPGAKNWAVYRSRFIEPLRIRAGLAFWRANANTLRQAQDTYGVPAQIIAGVIGVETIYGRNTGNFRVLDALSTLSLDFPKGRSDRSNFFQAELGEFLRMCAEEKLDPTSVLGSYAGAIGWPQFMPSSIRRFAVDFDRDGHIDLTTPADTIGSVANYLAANGWQKGMPTHFTVVPPKDEATLSALLGPDIVPSFTASELARQNTLLDPLGQQHTGLLALVALQNGPSAPPTYIAGTDNFYVITRYNQSSYYALAVIELGEALSQAMAQNNKNSQ